MPLVCYGYALRLLKGILPSDKLVAGFMGLSYVPLILLYEKKSALR